PDQSIRDRGGLRRRLLCSGGQLRHLVHIFRGIDAAGPEPCDYAADRPANARQHVFDGRLERYPVEPAPGRAMPGKSRSADTELTMTTSSLPRLSRLIMSAAAILFLLGGGSQLHAQSV